ncbi:MAG: hypothetical protein HVN35_07585 [Methanobacteriaceae archaeon]|nr:hypothetical protein [Methanobacteriaceae archaeon]
MKRKISIILALNFLLVFSFLGSVAGVEDEDWESDNWIEEPESFEEAMEYNFVDNAGVEDLPGISSSLPVMDTKNSFTINEAISHNLLNHFGISNPLLMVSSDAAARFERQKKSTLIISSDEIIEYLIEVPEVIRLPIPREINKR